MALTVAEHAGVLCLCFLGAAQASWVVSAVRNPLQGEVIAVVCHHFVLLIGVPVVADNVTLWGEKDSAGQVPREMGVSVPEGAKAWLGEANSGQWW